MKRWHTMLVIGWSLFAISYFLPVSRGGDTLADGVLPGWQALRGALTEGGLLGIASGLTNLLMLGTFLVFRIKTRRVVVALFLAIAASTLLNGWWLVSSDPMSDLLAGYYLWWLSFGVVAGGLSVCRRTLRPTKRR